MNFRKAFTLAEVMLFLMITAAVISIMFATTKPKQYLDQKAVKTKYATAYDALNIAAFDMVYKDETNPFIITEEDKNTGNTDHYQKLCKQIASYVNNSSEACRIPALSNNVTYLKNEDVDFKTLTPNIESLTGMKFYFSQLITDDKLPVEERSYYDAKTPDFTLQFFMVYVDVNGTEYPNRAHTIKYDQEKKKMPDVFAFAILPTGDVIPMGIAEYDAKFLPTRISYRENKSIYFSPYYSYRQAKHAAWHWYSPSDTNTKFKKTLSYTYNDYIREIMERNGTQLYNFNKDKIYPETYDSDLYQKCEIPAGSAFTYYDMCGLAFDTPKFGTAH